jgi:hypothetical protein
MVPMLLEKKKDVYETIKIYRLLDM